MRCMIMAWDCVRSIYCSILGSMMTNANYTLDILHICHFPIAHVIAGVQSVVLVWTQPIVESTHAFP